MHIFNGTTLIAFLNLKPEKRTEIKKIQISQIFTQGSLKIKLLLSLMEALSTCIDLEVIILNKNEIGKWNNERLKILGTGLLNVRTLKAIHLGDNQLNELTALGIQTFFGFLSLSSAQALFLQGNDFGKSNVSCLTELGKACAQFKYLQCLHLEYNSFDELNIAGFKAFFNALALSCLRELHLEGNGLGKVAGPFLAAFKEMLVKFKNLRIISVTQNKLKQSEDAYFEAFECSKTLCEIEGIQDFTALHQQALNAVLLRNENRLQLLLSTAKERAFSSACPQLLEHSRPQRFRKSLIVYLMLKDLKQDKMTSH